MIEWIMVMLGAVLLVVVLAIVLLIGQRLGLEHIGQLAPLSPAFQTEPMDVVYTWVDGSDPIWQSRRRAAQGLGPVPPGNGSNRSHDSGELEYSVKATRRSMGRLLHRIYIVTMDQVPAWVDPVRDYDVTIIDHRDIFPPGLITFNSNVIEQYLINIPGLTEWFLYLNDDVFMHKPVTKETFFCANDHPRFFSDRVGVSAWLASMITLGTEPTSMSRLTTDRLLRARYPACRYAATHSLIAHAPIVMSRSILTKLIKDNVEWITAANAHKFRQFDDFVFVAYFYPHYMIDHGLGSMCTKYKSWYVHITDAAVLNNLQFRYVKHSNHMQFLCLNDARTDNFKNTSTDIKNFLSSMYD